MKLHHWYDELKIVHASFANIYDTPGKFSLKDIKKEYLNEICPNYDKVLALGAKVGDVLDLMHIPHFKLPHPSGLNRKLNDSGFIEQTLEDCRWYLYGGHHL